MAWVAPSLAALWSVQGMGGACDVGLGPLEHWGSVGHLMHLKVKPSLNKAKSSVTLKNSAGRTLPCVQPSGIMALPALGLRAPSSLASLFCGDSQCHLLSLSQPQNPTLNRLAVWTGLTLGLVHPSRLENQVKMGCC